MPEPNALNPAAPQPIAPPPFAREDKLLWTAVLLGPFAAGVNTIVGFTVAHWVCGVHRKWTAFLVCFLDLAFCAISAALAATLRTRFTQSDDTSPLAGRRLFMANMAILLAAFCATIVLAGTAAVITLGPCD